MPRDDRARDLQRESQAAQSLIAALASDDDELTHDMVEGETDLFEAIEAALDEMDACDITATGCKAKEVEIANRRKRVEARQEKLRGLIEQALLVADIPQVKLPTATISVARVPPKPLIDDESAIPSEFWVPQAPKLDKNAVNTAVRDGRIVPGVTMTNGGTTLKIRRT